MSTAGKVLVVLVMLAILVWILMFAMAADLNANWGQQVQKLEADLARLDEQVAQGRAEIDQIKEQTTLEQIRRDKALTALRTALADVQRLQAEVDEDLSRASLQKDAVAAEVAAVQATLESRQQEKAQTDQQLAQAREELRQSKATNDDLIARLTGLQDDFKQTVEANQALLDRAERRSSASRPGRVRSAALRQVPSR